MTENSSFRPNWVSPPGETILDILKERNISIGKLATKLSKPEVYVNELLKGNESITADVAQKLQDSLGVSYEFWLTRETQYRDDVVRVGQVEASEWLKTLPVRDMINFGWISDTQNKVVECMRFFNVPDIKTWRMSYGDVLATTTFRKSEAFKSFLGPVSAWLRQGEILGAKLECKPWNAKTFEKALESIRPLTRKKSPEEFLPILSTLCAEAGVAIAVVRAPSGCRASGATKFVRKDRALLMLSFRYLSDDQFWFTFFHEAGHLLLHGDSTIIEGVHDVQNEVREREANLFAGEILVPHSLQQQLSKLKTNKRDIIKFAMLAGVSPGIIVGQMQNYGYVDKKYLNSYKRRYSWENIS